MNEDKVTLVEPDPSWPGLFDSESRRIETSLKGSRVEHIGSTRIPGIKSKPVIDILVGVPYSEELENAEIALSELGYDKEGSRDGHSWLSYPSRKNRQYIVHLVVYQAGEWQRRLKFRDYLITHAEAAAEYEKLKSKLAGPDGANIDAYTKGKAQFVEEIIEKAEKSV